MKTCIGTGFCLVFGLLLCRSSAQELRWRPVSPASPPANVPTSAAEPIPVLLSDPIPLNQTSYSSDDPAILRSASMRANSTDDDSVPRPLPPGTQILSSPSPTTLIEPPSNVIQLQPGQNPTQDGRIKQPPKAEPIPVMPAVLPNGSSGSSSGGGVLASPPCNCGGGQVVADGAVIGDGGGFCGGGCPVDGCGTCGIFSKAQGWLSSLKAHLFGGGYCTDGCCTNSCCTDGCCTDGCCTDGCCVNKFCADNCCMDNCCPDNCCMEGCMPSGCFDTCCYNGNRNHVWFTAEYLIWQFNGPNLPPLVTTGGAGTPLPTNPALTTGPALGQAGTQTLIGPGSFDGTTHSGMRFGLGFWLPCCDKLGLELGFLYFPQTSSTQTESSGILGRPFLDVTPGHAPFQTTEAVNGFNGTTGNVNVNLTQRLWGINGDVRYKLCCGPNFKLDFLAGYRNLNFTEGLGINENLSFAGGTNRISDNFNVNNAFNGGEIGLDGEWRFLPRWSLGGQIKLAMGCVRQTADISGSQSNPFIGVPNAPAGVGFFATNSNIGSYSRDQFAVLPEGNIRLGWDITKNVRIFVGYNILYLSSAMRAGNAVDTTINQNNLFGGSGVGPARPAFAFSNSSFLAQGANIGLDIHY